MKALVLLAVMLFSLTACSQGPDQMSRDEAISEIRAELPVNRDEAGDLIDDICAEFSEGRGGAVIDRKAGTPYELRETFAHVILVAAKAECPENVVDAETWQRYNGWD